MPTPKPSAKSQPRPVPVAKSTPVAQPGPIGKPSPFGKPSTMGKKAGKPKRKDEEDAEKSASVRPDEMPPDVLEFITAMDHYKRVHQRPFPNWSEVLEVVKSLGYVRARAS